MNFWMLIDPSIGNYPDVGGPTALPFLGQIVMVPYSGAPPLGWAECNGQALDRTRNDLLFLLLSDQFGGDAAANTFNLPDLRGRVPMGIGKGPELSFVDVNTKVGVEALPLATHQLPAHSHAIV